MAGLAMAFVAVIAIILRAICPTVRLVATSMALVAVIGLMGADRAQAHSVGGERAQHTERSSSSASVRVLYFAAKAVGSEALADHCCTDRSDGAGQTTCPNAHCASCLIALESRCLPFITIVSVRDPITPPDLNLSPHNAKPELGPPRSSC